jgi:hypothetical protein
MVVGDITSGVLDGGNLVHSAAAVNPTPKLRCLGRADACCAKRDFQAPLAFKASEGGDKFFCNSHRSATIAMPAVAKKMAKKSAS